VDARTHARVTPILGKSVTKRHLTMGRLIMEVKTAMKSKQTGADDFRIEAVAAQLEDAYQQTIATFLGGDCVEQMEIVRKLERAVPRGKRDGHPAAPPGLDRTGSSSREPEDSGAQGSAIGEQVAGWRSGSGGSELGPFSPPVPFAARAF
jgi:hypothetical protein